jgi:hypothetical protein
MNAKDVVDLLITAMDKIAFYWNFYVVLLIALIGWLVAAKKPLSVALKSLITVGFLTFVSMNIIGLYGAYTFAEALRTDLLAMGDAKALVHTYAILEGHSFLPQRTATFWIHLVVGLAVLGVVWLGGFGGSGAAESRRR